MSSITKDPISKQLELYEESWKTDHEQVKCTLWKVEDNLAVGLALYKTVILDRYWSWRDRVMRGAEMFRRQDEEEFKSRFVLWIRVCNELVDQLDHLERKYGLVEGGREFRRTFGEAKVILEKWEPPQPPQRAVAQTERAMTAQQLAQELDKVCQPARQEHVPLQGKTDYGPVF